MRKATQRSSKDATRQGASETEFRESGVSWLGRIPTHWSLQRLRYALSTNPSHSEIDDLPVDTEVSFVPMDAIGEYGGLNLSQSKRIDEIGAGFTYFRDGDVVVAKITPCFENWKGAHVTGLLNSIGFGTTELHVLRPRKSLDARFLFYITLSDAFRRLGEAEMYGAGGQKRVPDTFIRDLEWPLPPFAEQHVIARSLDAETEAIDRVITKHEYLRELLSTHRREFVARAVTRGLSEDVRLQESFIEWLGPVPEHWRVTKMRHVSSASSGGTPSKEDPEFWGGNFPWVTPKDMKRRLIASAEDAVTARALTETALRLFEPNAVLIVVRGMILAHSFPVALTTERVTINQDMKALRFAAEVHPEFAAWYLEGVGKRILRTIVEEAGHGTRVVRMDEWKSVPIPIPPLQEQREIVDAINSETDRIDSLLKNVTQALSRLVEYRRTVISNAVTGKTDLRTRAP